jgi:hypothetical protein
MGENEFLENNLFSNVNCQTNYFSVVIQNIIMWLSLFLLENLKLTIEANHIILD